MLEERKLQKVKIDLLRNPQFALMSGILDWWVRLASSMA